MKFTVVMFALIAGLSKAIRSPDSEAHRRVDLRNANQIGQEDHQRL